MIALINGSPKAKNSSSGYLLQALKPLLPQENVLTMYHFSKPLLDLDEMESLVEHKIWVFAFPLYGDGIPSHLLQNLIQLQTFISPLKKKKITVYALVNCGFYEGQQTKVSLEIMKNWCARSGLTWGQGVGIGAGGLLPMLGSVPLGQGPFKNLGNALTKFKDNLETGASKQNIYLQPNMPRFVYKFAGEMGWRKSIKANGLKPRDLSLRK